MTAHATMKGRHLYGRCLFCGGDASEPGHLLRCDGRQGAVDAQEPAPLDLRGMVHHDDPSTSIEAAVLIEPHRTELHQRVLDAFRARGPMTDSELEGLPEFHGYGPSTIRKRRSELYHTHQLVAVGERRNERNCKMLVWDVAE